MTELEITEAINYDRFEKFEPENLTCKCLVHFRPYSEWKGVGYGFDWMRLEDYMPQIFKDAAWDSANKGDTSYKKIVSRHYVKGAIGTIERDGNEEYGEYVFDQKLFDKLKNWYGYHKVQWKIIGQTESGSPITDEYYCSWLTIYPKKSALLSLIIDVDEIPEKLEFDFDPNLFTVSPKVIAGSSLKLGDNLLKDFLTVTCNNEFKGGDRNEKPINVFAYKEGEEEGQLAGQLFVWENYSAKLKTAKVILVEVKLTANKPASQFPTAEDLAIDVQTPAEDVFNQAYLSLGSNYILPLPLLDDLMFKPGGHYMTRGGDIIGYYQNTQSPPNRKDILDYLIEKFNSQYPGNIYDRYVKAFVFQEDGGKYQNGYFKRIGGYSNGKSNDIIIYKGKAPEVVAHEVLHSLGLPHSFTDSQADTRALFTYHNKLTNNIMDYSSPGARYTLWLWQSQIVNNKLDRDGYVK